MARIFPKLNELLNRLKHVGLESDRDINDFLHAQITSRERRLKLRTLAAFLVTEVFQLFRHMDFRLVQHSYELLLE